MAVSIRLARRGQTHRPFYHIVAADKRMARDGRFLEKIGTYNPIGKKEINVDLEKAKKWLSEGAQPTERVSKLLEISGAMEQFKSSKAG